MFSQFQGQQQAQQPAQGGALFGNFSQPPQQGSLFGNSNTAPSVTTSFGGIGQTLGQPTGGGGLFGSQPQQQQQAATGIFGQSPFGGGQQPLLGQTQAAQPLGNGSLFGGQQQQASLFGGLGGNQQQQQPTLGGGGGVFGLQQTQPATTTLFGGQSATPSTGLFGNAPQQNTGGGLFGGQQQQATPLFNQTQQQIQQPGLLFGSNLANTQPQNQGLFNPSGNNQFSQNSQQRPLWGSQQTNQGNTSIAGFGQQQQQQQAYTGTNGDDSLNDINIEPNSPKLEDSISSIVWSPGQPRFIAIGTWEGKVRVYEIIQNMQSRYLTERKQFTVDRIQQGYATQQQQVANPVLCIDWKSDGSIIFVGCGLDNSIKCIDSNSGQMTTLAQHNGPVINIFWIEKLQVLLSISTDQSLKIWDIRQPGQPKFQMNFNYKPLVADFNFPLLIIGFAQEKIAIIDINQMQNIRNVHYFESPLGLHSQLTSITLFPMNDGFGIGSIDGRGHMSNIEVKSQGQVSHYDLKNIMTFKAHKIEEASVPGGKNNNYFYPVNSVQFNTRMKQFLLTAGAEGQMIFWDYNVKNKIKTFNFNNVPITITKMSPDGSMLAYALGYDFSKGAEGYNLNIQSKLCIHVIPDNELRSSGKL